MTNELFRPSVIAAFAALLFLFSATGQVFDPDPSEPYANWNAESRYLGSWLGLMPPPIGWRCAAELHEVQPGLWLNDAVCVPDPALLEQQERERREWEERLIRNSERIRSGLGRRR